MKIKKVANRLLRKFTNLKIATLPTVSAADLAWAAPDDWEYLQVLLDAYAQQARPELLQNTLDELSDEQCVLVLSSDLCGQVNNGGFIQLIQNGYGPNIFNTPFADDLARWGAPQLAELVAQAHQAYLKRERALPEFSQLYQEFKEFEPLEAGFYAVEASQTTLVRAYVARHLDQFAHVL